MHTWHVATACYDRTGQLLGGGGMYVDAETPADAERKAIRIERATWGSPRMIVECKVTHVPGEGCTAYRNAAAMARCHDDNGDRLHDPLCSRSDAECREVNVR